MGELGARRRPHDTDWDSEEPGSPPRQPARIVSRNHLLNSSNYSLSSLFSVGSVGGSVASLHGSTRSSAASRARRQTSWQGPSCLTQLYQMLLAPFEDLLPASCNNSHAVSAAQNNMVKAFAPTSKLPSSDPELERDKCVPRTHCGVSDSAGAGGMLLTVPWGALYAGDEPLCSGTRYWRPRWRHWRPKTGENRLRRPMPARESPKRMKWECDAQWWELRGCARRRAGLLRPHITREAELVGDMLRCTPLTDYQASKEAVISQLTQAECVHLATHVCWKTPAVILSPGEVVDSQAKRLLSCSLSGGLADTGAEHEEESESGLYIDN
ncbi:Tetratricopeptide repeat protein 28 [Eumeta japonica]|uniref:Tetratricopeptide repeat protein 28 n=1 Tax=Eumeta variegata TaxID=151549 RepID=A0A4C2A9V4_EUMVA|nr:Tetratricopeptide repeat protein 28 [Eumeta japonica]